MEGACAIISRFLTSKQKHTRGDKGSQFLSYALIRGLKADRKSYIPQETAAIFFLANFFSKTGH